MQLIYFPNAIYNPKQLANRLKLYREQQGWSQTDIASRVGVKQSTISNFENHPEKTQLSTLFKIIQALEVELHVQTPAPLGSNFAANDAQMAHSDKVSGEVREKSPDDEEKW